VLSGLYATDGLGDGLQGFVRAMVTGWNASFILTAQSGQPYSARVSPFDLNNDGNTSNDIAPGTVRNQFRLPTTVTFDPRVARDIRFGGKPRLQLIFEVFNLFDRDNINAVNVGYYNVSGTTLTRNTNFGVPTSSLGERIIQLAAKVLF
jgi:hypothetical protein